MLALDEAAQPAAAELPEGGASAERPGPPEAAVSVVGPGHPDPAARAVPVEAHSAGP